MSDLIFGGRVTCLHFRTCDWWPTTVQVHSPQKGYVVEDVVSARGVSDQVAMAVILAESISASCHEIVASLLGFGPTRQQSFRMDRTTTTIALCDG